MNALLKPSYGSKRTELVPYEYTCIVCGAGVLNKEAVEPLITLGCCEEHVSKRITQLVRIEKEHGQMRHALEQIARVEPTPSLDNECKLLAAVKLNAQMAISGVRV